MKKYFYNIILIILLVIFPFLSLNLSSNYRVLNQEKNIDGTEIILYAETGFDHSAAVTLDSEGQQHLYTWGKNDAGQLGTGTNTNSLTPIEITYRFNDVRSFDDVSLGDDFSSAITTDTSGNQHLYTWGWNLSGQLGNGTNTDSSIPIDITYQFENVISFDDVSVGLGQSCLVTTDNLGNQHLWAWGDDSYGQLGNGTIDKDSSTPIDITYQFPNQKSFDEITSGFYDTATITTDSEGNQHLWTWGNNYSGQLGDGTTIDSSTPIDITDRFNNRTSFNDISIGANFLMVITTDPSDAQHLYTWGYNEYGQLGIGTTIDSSIPIDITYQFEDVASFNDVSTGFDFSSAITTDTLGNQHLYTWGDNDSGQLGNGTTIDSLIPIDITNQFEDVVSFDQVSLGQFNSLVIITSSSSQQHLYTWGRNDNGQLGDGTETNSSNPIVIFSSDIISPHYIEESFAINESTITTNSFEFSVQFLNDDSYGSLNQNSLSLYSNSNELTTSFESQDNNGNSSTYYYKVTNLQ